MWGAVFILICIPLVLAWKTTKNLLSYTYASQPAPGGLEHAIRLVHDNPDFYFLLGFYTDTYDYTAPKSKAIERYKQALEINPTNYDYWYYLANALADNNESEKASYAFKQAVKMSPGTVSLRWRAALLAAKLGDTDSVIDNLSNVIKVDPHRRNKAFTLLWQTVDDSQLILDTVHDDGLVHYLMFLINTKRTDEAIELWNRPNNIKTEYNKLYMRLINFLLRQNRVEEAKTIWAEDYGEFDGIWNGDFEGEIQNGGFGWRLNELEGVTYTKDSDSEKGQYSLKTTFDGKKNLNFYHIRQTVAVKPNTEYELTLFVKTKDISTKNGIYVNLYCPHSRGFSMSTKQLRGTHDWHKETLTFRTPADCRSIEVRLRRKESHRIDRYLSGSVWIDDVRLTEIGNTF